MDLESFYRDYRAERSGGREALILLPTPESTNLFARRILAYFSKAQRSAPLTLVAALGQSAGRGRLGRSWSSPLGKGIYASLVISGLQAESLHTLPLLIPVALCRALSRYTRSGCGIKWPNDLQVGGRKLGGILIEALSGEGNESSAVVGFGVNHSLGTDELPTQLATSLALEAEDYPSAGRVAGELMTAMEAELEHLGDLQYAVERYTRETIHQPGERLRCRTARGSAEGRFLGFDQRGFLRLETADNEEILMAAGDLELEEVGR